MWAEVERADLVVHAGDWVEVDLLDRLESRARAVLGCWGNNDGPALRARLPEVARATLGSVRVAVVHETGGKERREERMRSPTRTSTSSSSGTATSRGTQRIPDSGCSTPGPRPIAGNNRTAPT